MTNLSLSKIDLAVEKMRPCRYSASAGRYVIKAGLRVWVKSAT